MVRVDSEAVLGSRTALQRTKELIGHFDDHTTVATDQVAVVFAREVVGGSTVAQMDVLDHTKAFQLLEVAVDRRDMDVRCSAVDLGGQLVGSAVPACLDQATDEEAPWRRDAMSHRAEEFDDPLHSLVNSTLLVGCVSAHSASIRRRVPCDCPKTPPHP